MFIQFTVLPVCTPRNKALIETVIIVEFCQIAVAAGTHQRGWNKGLNLSWRN